MCSQLMHIFPQVFINGELFINQLLSCALVTGCESHFPKDPKYAYVAEKCLLEVENNITRGDEVAV